MAYYDPNDLDQVVEANPYAAAPPVPQPFSSAHPWGYGGTQAALPYLMGQPEPARQPMGQYMLGQQQPAPGGQYMLGQQRATPPAAAPERQPFPAAPEAIMPVEFDLPRQRMLHRLNASLAGIEEQVQTGVIDATTGARMRANVEQLRGPLLQLKAMAEGQQRQQQYQLRLQEAAENASVEVQNRALRTQTVPTKDVVNPLTGQTATLYESAPGKLAQVNWDAAAGQPQTMTASAPGGEEPLAVDDDGFDPGKAPHKMEIIQGGKKRDVTFNADGTTTSTTSGPGTDWTSQGAVPGARPAPVPQLGGAGWINFVQAGSPFGRMEQPPQPDAGPGSGVAPDGSYTSLPIDPDKMGFYLERAAEQLESSAPPPVYANGQPKPPHVYNAELERHKARVIDRANRWYDEDARRTRGGAGGAAGARGRQADPEVQAQEKAEKEAKEEQKFVQGRLDFHLGKIDQEEKEFAREQREAEKAAEANRQAVIDGKKPPRSTGPAVRPKPAYFGNYDAKHAEALRRMGLDYQRAYGREYGKPYDPFKGAEQVGGPAPKGEAPKQEGQAPQGQAKPEGAPVLDRKRAQVAAVLAKEPEKLQKAERVLEVMAKLDDITKASDQELADLYNGIAASGHALGYGPGQIEDLLARIKAEMSRKDRYKR